MPAVVAKPAELTSGGAGAAEISATATLVPSIIIITTTLPVILKVQLLIVPNSRVDPWSKGGYSMLA